MQKKGEWFLMLWLEKGLIFSGVILMPSYVNIGAYVDFGTMVDTWAQLWFLCSNW